MFFFNFIYKDHDPKQSLRKGGLFIHFCNISIIIEQYKISNKMWIQKVF